MLNEAIKARLGDDDAIEALVADRIYPAITPEPGGSPPAAFPAITYAHLAEPHEHSLEGPAGLARPRVQIDAWSNGADEAWKLSEAIRHSMDSFRGPIGDVTIVSALLDTRRGAIYEPVSKVFRVESEYLIFHHE